MIKKELRDLLVRIIDQKQLSGNDIMLIIEGLTEKCCNCKDENRHNTITFPPNTIPLTNPCVNPWEGNKVYCNEDDTKIKTDQPITTTSTCGFTYNIGSKSRTDIKENTYDPFVNYPHLKEGACVKNQP